MRNKELSTLVCVQVKTRLFFDLSIIQTFTSLLLLYYLFVAVTITALNHGLLPIPKSNLSKDTRTAREIRRRSAP